MSEDKIIRRNRGKGVYSRVTNRKEFEETMERIQENERKKKAKEQKGVDDANTSRQA